MQQKRKNCGIFISVFVAFLFMFQVNVRATNVDVQAGNTQEDTTIEYTVTKEPGKILLIPGEMRMISTVLPVGATYESNNTKVVLVSNSGQLIAQRAGTAKVTQTCGNEKKIFTIKVNDTVDLIVFAGQSNMCGSGGAAELAPTPSPGTAYEFDITTNTKRCILMKEPFGEGRNRNNGLITNSKYSTKGTLASAFAINYYKQTKTPVVGIPCAWGGSSTNTWLERGLVSETQRVVKLAKKKLKKDKIKVRHIYMVWYQGESDASQGRTASKYISNMKKIYSRMKKVGVEKIFMIKIGHDLTAPDKDYTIMSAQTKLCKTNKNFVLVSKKAPKFYASYRSYYTDTIHINQKGLNKIGYEAGKAAGIYVKKNTKSK